LFAIEDGRTWSERRRSTVWKWISVEEYSNLFYLERNEGIDQFNVNIGKSYIKKSLAFSISRRSISLFELQINEMKKQETFPFHQDLKHENNNFFS
jgi:hypothetical protein